jgi:hypothetical protein
LHIHEIKALHPKARHWCYGACFGLNPVSERCSDDGEPTGTAGQPILNAVNREDIAAAIASYLMMDETRKLIINIMSLSWGLGLGWYHSVQRAFFSVLVPQERATEMSGFFSVCTIIIAWVPALVFTWMNESDIHMQFGMLRQVGYFLITIGRNAEGVAFHRFGRQWN